MNSINLLTKYLAVSSSMFNKLMLAPLVLVVILAVQRDLS